MSLILCIETSTEVCSAALSENGQTISLFEITGGNMHAAQLHPLVQQTLSKAGISLNQLNAVAVSKGPGSYTGLRVGVSAAKGFCYALNIPFIAIDSLTSLTNHLLKTKSGLSDFLLVPLIDARRMEVYTSTFDHQLNMIEPISAKIIDEHAWATLLDQNKLMFFGNGAEKCKGVIVNKNAFFEDGIQCSANGLSIPAHLAFGQNRFENLAYFEPLYLKDFVGTTPKKK